jgi:Tfp pilus assembly PilM family ATPase
MGSFADILGRLRPKILDATGVEIGPDATVAVRIQKAETGLTLVATATLPPVVLPTPEGQSLAPLAIPHELRSRYASFAVATPRSLVRLVNLPGSFDLQAEGKLVESLGIENPETFRIGHRVLVEGHARGESRVLVAALPDDIATEIPGLVPTGFPVPYSLEVAESAILTSFSQKAGSAEAEGAVGLVHFAADNCTFYVFNKGVLGLIRRFDVGTNAVVAKLQDSLSVDRDTAAGILTEGAFDISGILEQVVAPMLKQMVMGRDFIERRENCRVGRFFVSGSVTRSAGVISEINKNLGTSAEAWSPLDGLTVLPNAMPGSLVGSEWRFGAAVGAAIASLEEA